METLTKFFDQAIMDKDIFWPINIMLDSKSFPIAYKSSEDDYVVEAGVPGVEKSNIEINYKESNLIISVKCEQKDLDYSEFNCGEFKRILKIKDIDFDKSEASLNDGILKIRLPKANSGKQTLKIK